MVNSIFRIVLFNTVSSLGTAMEKREREMDKMRPRDMDIHKDR